MKKAIIFSGAIAVCAVVIGSSVKAAEFPKPSPTVPENSVTLAQNREDNKAASSPTKPNPDSDAQGEEVPASPNKRTAAEVVRDLNIQIIKNTEDTRKFLDSLPPLPGSGKKD
jgi:hypothetical protein